MTDERRTIALQSGTFPVVVHLVDAIAAVQEAGYLVYEIGELPEITVVGGKPKLPAYWGQVREGVDLQTALYEEGFGKLALARWWEKEAERVEKRTAALERELGEINLSNASSPAIAKFLVERGWRRG